MSSGESGSPDLRRSLGRSQDQIAAALDREFEQQFHRLYNKSPDRDPALQTLFYTLASQISRVHDDAQRVFPEAVLDDLVAGLGTEPRLAEAAQTIVEFSGITQREWITPDTALVGQNPQGDRIPFSPDAPFQVSKAAIRVAAMLEPDFVQGLSGAVIDGTELPPLRVDVPTGVAGPTLYLAIEADPSHLSYQSLFLDIVPSDGPLAGLLKNSVWRVLGEDGTVHPQGALRSLDGRGGTRRLVWFDQPDLAEENPASEVQHALNLGRAAYGPLVYRFPFVPEGRRFVGEPPPGFRRVISQVLPEGMEGTLDRPMTWLEIVLPPAAASSSGQVRGVHLHAMTASNAEVISEIVSFSRTGQAVAHSPEGLARRHVLGIVSVQGTSPYLHMSDLGLDDANDAGFWSYRNGRIEITPGRSDSGRVDTHANVRILFCDGEAANGLDLDTVNRVDTTHLENVGLRVTNLAISKGGMAPPQYAEAKVRFAAAVRTRERVVTEADFEIVARAFEGRIRDVSVEVASEVTPQGMQVAEIVTISVDKALFADAEAELPVLSSRLEEYLQDRVGLGRVVRVEVAP